MDDGAFRGHWFEDLVVGMSASYERIVIDADIRAFASLSGDDNPLHLDAAYAAATPFKERIAHGMLTASYISTVFGTKLPGPGCIYVSQTLSFRGPVKIGDAVAAQVTIQELVPAKRRVMFSCEVTANGKLALAGEAVLMVPGRPA